MGSIEISRNSIFLPQIPLNVFWLSPNTQMWDRSASKGFGRAGYASCAMDPLLRPQRCCQLCHYFSSFLSSFAGCGTDHRNCTNKTGTKTKKQPRNQGTIFGKIANKMIILLSVACTKSSKFSYIYLYIQNALQWTSVLSEWCGSFYHKHRYFSGKY